MQPLQLIKIINVQLLSLQMQMVLLKLQQVAVAKTAQNLQLLSKTRNIDYSNYSVNHLKQSSDSIFKKDREFS